MKTKTDKKIVHFSHWSRNGITSLIKTICSNFIDGEIYFFLLNSDEKFDDYYSAIKNKNQFFINKNPIKSIFRIYKMFRSLGADVVHAHSFTPFIISCLFSGKAKIIFHFHSEYPYMYDKKIKSLIKRLCIYVASIFKDITFIAVTEKSAEYAERFTGKRCIYVPNGIPDVGGIREGFAKEYHRNRFYSVGRLDKQKNIEYAIILLHELIKRGYDVSYSIYGEGAEFENLENLIRSLDVGRNIYLKGFNDFPECLPSENDFFLSTSKQEGLSLSALHGMRGQTPLITTAFGQIGSVLKNSENGFLLSLSLGKDLAILERAILMAPDELNKIQERARVAYLEQFTEKRFLECMFSFY